MHICVWWGINPRLHVHLTYPYAWRTANKITFEQAEQRKASEGGAEGGAGNEEEDLARKVCGSILSFMYI